LQENPATSLYLPAASVENGRMPDEPRLSPEDQARVDKFLSSGVNSVQRKPFHPFRLALILLAIVSSLSVLSVMLARWAGVY
jgi:multisubunit Na+/H+ antiporter MnhC subunit